VDSERVSVFQQLLDAGVSRELLLEVNSNDYNTSKVWTLLLRCSESCPPQLSVGKIEHTLDRVASGQPFLIPGDHTRRTRRSRRGIGEFRPTIAQSRGEVDDSPSARPAEVPEMATLNCFHSLLSGLLKVRIRNSLPVALELM